MDRQPVRELLKTSPKRSVRLESGGLSGAPGERIVKRFHGPDLLDRFRDRLRARNEFELLGRLRALGLPVPRPLELSRRQGAWEVATEYLPGARPLDEWLRDAPDAPAHAALACELGRLVARLFAVGLDHRDLHPGNFLVQENPSGPPGLWLIDLAKSRLRPRASARQMQGDLVQLAAGLRELVGDGARRRFLVALLAHLPADLRRSLPARAELGRSIEDGARVFRGRDIARRTRRWLRDSSSVEPYDDERGRGFLRRDIEPAFPHEVTSALIGGRWLRGGRIEVGRRAAWIVEERDAGKLRDIWRRQVRLHTHGLPCLAPLCIAEGPRPWIALEAERDWSPLAAAPAVDGAEDAAPRERLIESLGGLIGALHDRLLDVSELPPGSIWHDTRGHVRFGLLSGLTDRFTDGATRHPASPGSLFPGPREAFEPWTGPWSAEDRARYREGYARSLRHSAAERARLRAGGDA